MSWRSWVDDCPTGILSDCAMDRKKKRVLTQTQAAFESYNQMLGQNDGDDNKDNSEEKFSNYQESSWGVLLVVLLLILVLIFILIR